MTREVPFLSADPVNALCHDCDPLTPAGLLTYGSFYWLRLPVAAGRNSGIYTAVVPDYSGGPVPDFHGIPY